MDLKRLRRLVRRVLPLVAITPLVAPGSEMASEPLSPEASLSKIHVPAGFRVELAAAEPLLLDPVAFDWDKRGRLWVVEMADYPLGMDNRGKPGGRIRVLEDSDGDGRYDRSAVFAEGLNFPNGILTWRDGVIVTAAPNVLFLRDTNADGRADEQTVLVSGLQEGNQQLRANGLRWGLDNWVYLAIGGHHGKYGVNTRLTSTRTGKEIVVGSRDFRFRPDTGELEPQSGPTQFGRNRDNWGRWFGSQNTNPLWHYVLPDHYLKRNPHYGAPETRVQLLTPPSPPVYPANAPEKRFHSFGEAGHFTSACSGVIYRDRLIFPAQEIHGFACEPFHNLVQHAQLTDHGVTFTAKRVAGEGSFDFFASEDRWCRPVMVREGPDGALWIADMYRYMIEHPDWLPQEGKDDLLPHYRAGDGRGRIYRVSRDSMAPARLPRFDKMSTAELVAALESSNGWQRDKIQQLLLWRADKAAVAPLRELAAQSASPLTRLHALCTLDGLGELSPEVLEHALNDQEPGVRENALRLAESRFTPALISAAAKLVSDRDAKVRMQLAFSLGAASDPTAGEALANLLTGHADETLMTAAVLSSAVPHLRQLTAAAAASEKPLGAASDALLLTAIGLKDREALVALLTPIFTAGEKRFTASQLAAFTRLLDQLAQAGHTLEQLQAGGKGDALANLLSRAEALITQARQTAMDSGAPALEQIAAASLMVRDSASREAAVAALSSWLKPQHPSDVQAAAIRALTAAGTKEIPDALESAWPNMEPLTRQIALEAWMSREPWALDLLQRMERGALPLATVDATQRARLTRHASKRISQLANKVFASTSPVRAKVIESYRPALSLKGDPANGRAIFTAVCAACHKRGLEGRDIGPDLLTIVEHPPEKILGNILDPSADIQPGFSAYTCTLKTGEQLYGLLASESASSVAIKLLDGSSRTVLRNQIQSLQSQNLSLMPEGLEAAISHQQMADLIAFLRSPAAKP